MTDCGHGWVHPRPDGMKARCGGPGLCTQCSADEARKTQHKDTEKVWTLEEAMESLFHAGPGAQCEDCGHFAQRHVVGTCYFPAEVHEGRKPCDCGGMQWHGFRFTMSSRSGPIDEWKKVK